MAIKQNFTPQHREVLTLRQQILDALADHDMSKAVELYERLRGLDPEQALPTQGQLDLANQLMAQGDYKQAAEGYELFLKSYPSYQQNGEVELMLGLLYSRYLNESGRAREHLAKALDELPEDSPARQMCQTELERIGPTDSA